MTHLQKLTKTSMLKWVSSNFVENPACSFYSAQNPRLYRTKKTVKPESVESLGGTLLAGSEDVSKMSLAARKEAQAALFEYLHYSRSLHFMDAEGMSKNSPYFLEKILRKFENEADIRRSMTRFFRFHPINEFEPFFESWGLKPSEYSSLLPRNLMYLSDDTLMLENYHVLCDYGIARNKIGRIYKEAKEVFEYEFGVLRSKLQAYKELGLSQSFMGKVIVCSPYILIGDVNVEFVKVVEILKSVGMEFSWIEEHLSEKSSYNWSMMFNLLSFLSKIDLNEEQLGSLMREHPEILFERSGDRALTLIGFLLKFGSTKNELSSMFLQFPQIQVEKFALNLRQCVMFLNEIEMELKEIGSIVRSYPALLGSCSLKKTNSLLGVLNVGKKRLCKYIRENPEEMKKWVMGSKVGPLPDSGKREISQILKTKFLLDVGFAENSKPMERALKLLRARGLELQERFDCIVKAGIDQRDACKMIRVCPLILNQSKDVINAKINFLLNDLGYPISSLISFPQYLAYTMQRVKLRLLMYNWLRDQGLLDHMLALSTLIACSDKIYVNRYVNLHARGPQVWLDLEKQICSD